MAHQEFTGKSGGTTVTYGGASIPTGWQEITIDEKGAPKAEQINKTHAGDGSWQWMDDPLGGAGSPSCQVTITGLWSVTDHKDNGLIKETIDAAKTLIVTTGTGSDLFTLTSAQFKGIDAGAAFADIQPFSATFSNSTSAGAWTTQGA